MTVKRMMLLLVSTAALLTCAAPAAAQAQKWYLEGEGPEGSDLEVGNEENATTPLLLGALRYTVPQMSEEVGPCAVKAELEVWNGPEYGEEEPVASAELRAFVFERMSELYECNLKVGGYTCGLTGLSPSWGPPWPIEVSEGQLAIEEMNLWWTAEPICAFYNDHASGEVIAYWNNETHCMEFEGESSMLEIHGFPVSVDGELCDTSQKLVLY